MAATETFGPFDGVPWTQDAWYRNAPSWAPSGVIGTPASSSTTGSFALTFNGLTATLAAGQAWARGAGYQLAGGSKALTIAANTNSSLSRMDRVVLRRDVAAKTVTMLVLQGTPASSPAAPALTQVDTGQWDVPLFSFLVPPNSGTVITGVVDERSWVDPAQPRFRGSGASFPANPNVGDTFFHTTLKCEHVYVGGVTDGAAWRQTTVAQIGGTITTVSDYIASVTAAGASFHYDFLAYEVATKTLYVADSGTTLRPVSNHSLARVAFTSTGKVNPDAAICTISIPAVPYPSRVILAANGKTGFTSTDSNVSWDYDTIPSGATNVIEDTTEGVYSVAGKWTALTHTLSMDLPANTAASPRLVARSDVGVYNRGGVTWHRGPIS